MPRTVRNFWLDASIDGRRSYLSGGPRSKDGGFTLSVKVRDHGGITKALTISGRAKDDGSLVLSVDDPAGPTFYEKAFSR